MEFFLAKKDTDVKKGYDLVKTLAVYEGESIEGVVPWSVFEEYVKDGIFNLLLAKDNDSDKIVGMALLYFRYSTWKGKQVHLDDFYIDESYRGKGLGTKMFKEIKYFAKNNNASVVEWVVHDVNDKARTFYLKQGAYHASEWDIFRIEL